MGKVSPRHIKRVTRRTIHNVTKSPLTASRSYWDEWSQREQEWADQYEGAPVKTASTSATFLRHRPKRYLGRRGKLCRFQHAGEQVVFMPNVQAWHKGFSGVEVCVDFGDGENSLALIEEIQFLPLSVPTILKSFAMVLLDPIQA